MLRVRANSPCPRFFYRRRAVRQANRFGVGRERIKQPNRDCVEQPAERSGRRPRTDSHIKAGFDGLQRGFLTQGRHLREELN
jgi:hypothetical protein